MFASVLIANRGEIAGRIARTARRLGLRVIAVHSAADRDAPFVRLADTAVDIGPAPAAGSYLSIPRLIDAIRLSAADAVHPGYGFLAENAAFAEAVVAAGAVFVGPPAPVIRAMGMKDEAKALMALAGVPVLDGVACDPRDAAGADAAAAALGYPVMVKAVAGGGGKGMRRVASASGLPDALAACAREAEAAFGDPRLILERCIDRPRHIEVQVFADRHGNVVHLHERDCSLQRRHQKVIEEAPAPNLPPTLRAAMFEAAVAAARAVRYEGAGTVEFICACDAAGTPADFRFLEMNTRLQVEHPVTEAITGLDLVEWQFRVAAGERLPLAQGAIAVSGHAVEARLYAENPANGFLPQTGTLQRVRWPDGVRVETGMEEGGEITPYYDPMIAKVIAHAATREAALTQLAAALGEVRLDGVITNRGFLRRLVSDPEVCEGRVDTGLIDRHLERLAAPDPALVAVAVRALAEPGQPSRLPFSALQGFALAGMERRDRLRMLCNGVAQNVDIKWISSDNSEIDSGDGVVSVTHWQAAGERIRCCVNGRPFAARQRRTGGRIWLSSADGDVDIALAPLDVTRRSSARGGDGLARAPMPGRIGRLLVSEGAAVEAGDPLLTLEAMKMEHMVRASIAGAVRFAVEAGEQVAEGGLLAGIAPREATG